jgi:hypothetical protein
VNPVLVGVALAVTAGAVIAISAREARTALVGLAIVLGIAPFLSDPLPEVSTLAARVVGGALAAYLLRAAISGSPAPPVRGPRLPNGSRIGWPADLLFAAAAWVVGIAVASGLATLLPSGPARVPTDLVGSLTPAAVTTAAGLASIVISVVPAFAGRGAFRTAVGSLVLVQGVLLFRLGVAGPPSDLEQLGGVGLLIAIAVAGAWLLAAEAGRDRAEAEGRRGSSAPGITVDVEPMLADPR